MKLTKGKQTIVTGSPAEQVALKAKGFHEAKTKRQKPAENPAEKPEVKTEKK